MRKHGDRPAATAQVVVPALLVRGALAARHAGGPFALLRDRHPVARGRRHAAGPTPRRAARRVPGNDRSRPLNAAASAASGAGHAELLGSAEFPRGVRPALRGFWCESPFLPALLQERGLLAG